MRLSGPWMWGDSSYWPKILLWKTWWSEMISSIIPQTQRMSGGRITCTFLKRQFSSPSRRTAVKVRWPPLIWAWWNKIPSQRVAHEWEHFAWTRDPHFPIQHCLESSCHISLESLSLGHIHKLCGLVLKDGWSRNLPKSCRVISIIDIRT